MPGNSAGKQEKGSFMRKAFITGSSGFIGYHLARLLLDEGWQVAGDGVPFVVLPISREALGQRIGRGSRAAVGVTPSRSARHLHRQLRRLRRGEISSFGFEKRYLRADGEAVWVRLDASMVMDAQSEAGAMLGLMSTDSRPRPR